MKLQDFNNLVKQPKKHTKQFLERCSVSEKIDSHYVKVKILGPGNITLNKQTGNIITQVDCIVNAMWGRFIEDFNFIKNSLAFNEFCSKYRGCSLNFFYIPCKTPLSTQYEFGDYERCYVMSQCYDMVNKAEVDLSIVWSDFKKYLSEQMVKNIGSRFTFRQQEYFKFNPEKLDEFVEKFYNGEEYDLNEYIDYEAEKLLNIDKNINDVSLVFRYDNKYFQINKEVHQYNSDSHEYSSYEFVLCDFLDFWKKEHERLIPNIRGTYRNIICYLFNEYITTRECIFHNIENNVNTEALEPMRFGYDHGDLIIPSYVPNLKSITLCKHHLYRNIFKILLVNLQIFKKFKYCVYMSKEQVREFNNIAKTINQLKAGYNAH